MSDIKIVDVGGQWVTNPHAFAFVDPESGVRFSPATLTKVEYSETSWIAVQINAGTLAKAEDPMKSTKPEKEPPKATSKAHGKAEG